MHQLKDWPSFSLDTEAILVRVGEVRHSRIEELGWL